MPDLTSPSGLLPPHHIDPDTQDFFLVRVPSHLPVSVLQDSTIDLRRPGAVAHGGREYQAVVRAGAGPTAVLLPGGPGGHQMTSLEVKAVVTLQEAVAVPPMPDITVPERYRVPRREGLLESRHPIYGVTHKREAVKAEPEEEPRRKKKKNKSHVDDNMEVDVKQEPLDDTEKHKKKKKKKDKDS